MKRCWFETAKLPKVELEDPGMAICKNTINAMQSGLVYGHMGMVEFIVNKMKKELIDLGATKPVKIVATGGLATLIERGLDCIDYVDKMLSLEGLQIIYDKNKKATVPGCHPATPIASKNLTI